MERIAAGERVTGVDIDWSSVRLAQSKHKHANTAFTQASATAMPFPDASFDKMYGVCSVEHIPDNAAAFGEFSRCLKSGGVLALTLDSLSFPTITEEHRRDHHAKYFTPHLYTLEKVSTCLEVAGFRLTDHDFIVSSRGAHALYLQFDRRPRLQYILFPVAYPFIRVSDQLFGSREHGWKLAIRALKA
jgi:SAM-dependent methyltransferase